MPGQAAGPFKTHCIKNVPINDSADATAATKRRTGKWLGEAIEAYIRTGLVPGELTDGDGETAMWTIKKVPITSVLALANAAKNSHRTQAEWAVAAIRHRLANPLGLQNIPHKTTPPSPIASSLTLELCDQLLGVVHALRDECRRNAALLG